MLSSATAPGSICPPSTELSHAEIGQDHRQRATSQGRLEGL
jgi:hypothetical protein